MYFKCIFLSCFLILNLGQSFGNNNEEDAKEFLAKYNIEAGILTNEMTVADWNYTTNITEENAQISQAAGFKLSVFNAEAFANASQFNTTNFSPDTKRQLGKVGSKSLPEEEMKELSSILGTMGDIYGSAKVCVPTEHGDECFYLEPGLTEIMAESTNYTERLYVWEEWRRIVGRPIKPLYQRYVELENKLAVLNGFTDYGDRWRSQYETDSFQEDIAELYSQMEPMYKELHAYIRRKLYDVYGEEFIDIRGTLPAHLLSDMWGRFWLNLYKISEPFHGKPAVDPSPAMKEQNYTVAKMFQTGDDFYAGMGLFRVPDTFWNLSMLEKPDDGREVICHATAWDFYDTKDYRIRMCAKDFSFEDLNTIHHELGHIQYDQQYKHLPMVYRDGANGGFHEAVGEMMAMIGATPKHLYSIGLLDELVEDDELDINFLLSQALITISTLPFHLVNDMWRWKIFSGEVPLEEWNDLYWQMNHDVVGVNTPVERSSLDLDPPTIYHIAQDYPMINYFVRTILQFQFAEKLCEISGHVGPFHRCDFSGSSEVGSALSEMLGFGSSQPWQDSLESLTGERKMSARAILKFFDPLYEWLQFTNFENGDVPGWDL